MNRRAVGCKNLHYAVGTIGEEGILTYDTPKRVVGLQEFSTTNNYSEYTFYSDDQVDESGKSLTSVELALIVKGLDPTIEADFMGKEYDETSGVLTTSVDDQQKVIALMYEITTLGKSYFRVLYNCKLAKDEMNSTGKTDNVESNDVSLSGMAIPNSKGKVDRIVDAEVAGSTEIVSSFFTKVYEPTV